MEHINKGIKCFELSHTPAHSFPSLHPSGGCSCSQGNNLLGWWLWKSTTSWTGWRTETAQNVLLHIGICRWSHTILCLLAQQPLMKTSVLKLVKYFAWSLLFFFFSWGFLIVFLQTYSFTYCALYMYECLFICTCQIASSSHHSVQLLQIFLLFFWQTCGTKMIGLRKLLSRWNSRIW